MSECFLALCVWLFVTLWTVPCHAPLSMGFFRQEYWSGLPFSPSLDSSWPRDWTHVSCIGTWILYHRTIRAAQRTPPGEYHFLDKLALIFQNKVRYLSLVFSQILNPPELHYTVLIILLFSPISLTNLGRQAFVIGFYDISLAFNLVGTE